MGSVMRICFVCTGNICRSPMAEQVMRERLAEAGLAGRVVVDSAGTGSWHEGDPADERAVRVLREAGYESEHVARQFHADWFRDLDLVVALDRGHERALRRLARTSAEADKIRLLRSYDPASSADELDVPDPYYGDLTGFEEVLRLCEAGCDGLLAEVRTRVG
ncbi:low molecular weight protein-tyrosine-phosphatase [Streptacidiphilus jiangxiensis]|uniref:protein-tyrosine-phosphatase n=1 Tax=Streptacidiphilus jiangxiensis TaxID=235985 RepID=A0A1H7MAM9_STRJI|nr:low molecular weight protein-tyrosine-phosphatase [Streptacidiphilus jiangxiensis]SEL08139.1 protein-tyrosine phosphatase [Streptacidiphilus jiangxiensis]